MQLSRATLRAFYFLAAAATVIGVAIAPSSARAQEPLKIGVIPYDTPGKLRTEYTPFANFLAKETGRRAQVFVATNYVGVIQALQADQIDCAYLNPLSYVLFLDKMRSSPEHLIPIAMPYVHGSLYYYGAIFTRVGSGINTIAQLKGKKFAFTQPTSTSGYLYPFIFLRKHGIDPNHDFAEKYFASDTGVVPAVLNSSADAGALFEEGIQPPFVRPDQQKQIKELARIGPIANGMFVVRGNLDPRLIGQIKKALHDINIAPDGKAANAALQVAKWAPAHDSVFDPVRQAARVLGINLQSLNAPHK